MSVALGIAAIFALLACAGIVWQAFAELSDSRKYACPGSMLESLHVHCAGEGAPVVLEAGIAASSVGWALVHRELAEFCRVCSYDRPGLGWSEWRNQPRTTEGMLEDLRKVVHLTGRPAILVGHSFGGLLARLYAAAHPEDVRALVLVDPALTCQWSDPSPQRAAMLNRGVRLSKRGALLARFGFVRLALTLLRRGSATGARLFAKAASGRASSVTDRIAGQVRKLPPELWPVVQSHWCRTQSFISMAEHLACLPQISAEAARVPPAPDLEVVVISGSHLNADELREHQSLATRHIIAERSGHWVHMDRPDVIVGAIRSLIHG